MKAWLLLALLAAPVAAQSMAAQGMAAQGMAEQTSQPAPLAPPFFDRGSLTLRNATDQPLRQLFLWNQFLPQEGEDRLAGQTLPPGGTRPLELGMGHCQVALRAVFADGGEMRLPLLHACHARELRLEAPGAPEATRIIPR